MPSTVRYEVNSDGASATISQNEDNNNDSTVTPPRNTEELIGFISAFCSFFLFFIGTIGVIIYGLYWMNLNSRANQTNSTINDTAHF